MLRRGFFSISNEIETYIVKTKEKGMKQVFISYSWDDENHKEWVMNLRNRLCADGVSIILDRVDMSLGDSIPLFMEQSIKNANVILLILTPRYKEKSDNRMGGVGYEGAIITGDILNGKNKKRFIPVLARGDWSSSSPIWAVGRNGVNLTGNPYSEEEYSRLLSALLQRDNEVLQDIDLTYSLSGKQMKLIALIYGTEGQTVSELINLSGMTKNSIQYQLSGLISQVLLIS